MKDELAALLPRLEGGEASREVDRLIRAALAGPDETSHIDAGGNRHRSVRTWLSDAPPYTTSLDAALALAERVLPGWDWMVRGNHDGRCSSFARMFGPSTWEPGNDIESFSFDRNPALALCAAIVKAKIGEVG